MAQIIVSSRYLKSGKRGKTKRRNYTKYIATRESVEKRPQNTGRTTDNQKQLISELIKEFPMAKQYLEYADYTKIDNELVRNYGTYGRADAVLPTGEIKDALPDQSPRFVQAQIRYRQHCL